VNRLVAVSTVAATALMAAACTGSPASIPPPPAPVGEYRGHVTLEGVERPATLSLIPREAGVRAVLHVSGGALAFGPADWLDGTLYMGFDYGRTLDPPCGGRMLVVAVPDSAGLHLNGELHARDCTGSAQGSIDFGLYSAIPELRTESLTPSSEVR